MNRKRLPYDAVVIGGGAAGLVTATLAARLGARTALVERERLGGDCTWHGCIPSKTLLRSAATAQAVRNAGRFGIATGAPRVVWSEIRSRLDEIRERIYREADAPEVVAKSGIEVIFGAARFVDARAVRVPHTDGGEAFLAAGRFFICSGSAPKPFPFDVPYLTSETIFDLDEQPKRLLIVGAGPLGIESAQAFARLGSEVHVVTRARRILPRDDAEHAATLQAALEAEGVRFTFEAEPVGAELVGDERRVSLRDGTVLAADAILSAIGRVPRIAQLGVEAAGVRTRDGAIAVDARGRTSA
ncbi:MAG: FAD-dependent oxidoreductase, partial [Candidatus Dormibacteria bacterium]